MSRKELLLLPEEYRRYYKSKSIDEIYQIPGTHYPKSNDRDLPPLSNTQRTAIKRLSKRYKLKRNISTNTKGFKELVASINATRAEVIYSLPAVLNSEEEINLYSAIQRLARATKIFYEEAK